MSTELERSNAELVEVNAALAETYARYQRKLGRARACLREAIALFEARPEKPSPTLSACLIEWRAALEYDGRDGQTNHSSQEKP